MDAGSCYELFEHAAKLGIRLEDGLYPLQPKAEIALSLTLPFKADNALVADAKPAQNTYLASHQTGSVAIAWTRAADLEPEAKRTHSAALLQRWCVQRCVHMRGFFCRQLTVIAACSSFCSQDLGTAQQQRRGQHP